MKKYEKPLLIANEGFAEGVYAASGADSSSADDSDCYTATASIHQKPETGRGDYRIQVNGVHAASDGHHSGEQHLFLSFNQSVTYSSSNGELVSGDNTSCIEINIIMEMIILGLAMLLLRQRQDLLFLLQH